MGVFLFNPGYVRQDADSCVFRLQGRALYVAEFLTNFLILGWSLTRKFLISNDHQVHEQIFDLSSLLKYIL